MADPWENFVAGANDTGPGKRRVAWFPQDTAFVRLHSVRKSGFAEKCLVEDLVVAQIGRYVVEGR